MQQPLIPHLFRTEFAKITSVLCKLFGIGNIELAEDIASETFLAALETWPYKGVPENPAAWLYTVAKNKAKNHFKHQQVFDDKIAPQLKVPLQEVLDVDLSDANVTDSQLQMLFAVCHPAIPVESQIGLSLRILCGFGIDEIATALLTNKENINKRLFRAKEKLRSGNIQLTFPGEAALQTRIDAVLRTLYLLFSEGYYSENNDEVLRESLCEEAMRLTNLLIENEQTDQPPVHALFSLMCFHASRFKARKNISGESILYDQQDELLWDQSLISKGACHLNEASKGDHISTYHLEAGIAYWHTIKADTKAKWENILFLYNRLLQLEYSPVAALNRTYAFSKVHGTAAAIIEAEKLELNNNHFYFTLLGELNKDVDRSIAMMHFERALSLAKTTNDKNTIQQKIVLLDKLADNENSHNDNEL